MVEFSKSGRRLTEAQFFGDLSGRLMDMALKTLEERVHAATSAIVDPETGRRPDVIVHRGGDASILIKTTGSPAFARELERRLELSVGTIVTTGDQVPSRPLVYLAHASDDHEALARPLAEKLMSAGIEVWLDAWEIRTGDSLKRKMEEGLAESTHFLVLLTPNSVGKAWVEREIDAGFIRAVNGKSRFLGLRIGVAVGSLSEFLQTVRCPSVNLGDESQIADIISDIFGATRKPALGDKPKYVQSAPEGLKGWSKAATAIARSLALASERGKVFDPQSNVTRMADATGLTPGDVNIGLLDLEDGGLIERSRTTMSDTFWPKAAFFVEFDRHFMDFDNRVDARALANRLVEIDKGQIAVAKLAEIYSDWNPRRLNSALHYLQAIRAVETVTHLGVSDWVASTVLITDRTHRYVRDQS